MKYLTKIFFVTTIFFVSLLADESVQSVDDQNKPISPFYVRVLLEERVAKDPAFWQIEGESGVVIVDRDNPKNNTLCKGVRVFVREDGIAVIDTQRRVWKGIQALRINSQDGYLQVNGKWYQGSLFIFKEGDKALFINNIDLEDYLFSVIKEEGWPAWPLEMNKVMAVAARSYVVYKVLEAQKQGKLFHIKNTNAHQKYNGYHDYHDLKQAVDETRGIVLTHHAQPILAMFDICCGGVVPAKKRGVNFVTAPYLARTYACTHCKTYKFYKWSVEYNVGELERIFQKEFSSLKKLKEVKINKKDNAGIVQQLTVKAGSGYHQLSARKIYSMLKKDVKSFCFSVMKRSQKIIFKGKGYGHHLGLCQWGARQMVRESWHWDRILQFYFPGTVCMKLQLPELKKEVYA